MRTFGFSKYQDKKRQYDMENLYYIGYSEKGILLQRIIPDPRRGGEGILMAKNTVNSTYLINDQENNTYHIKHNAKIAYRYYNRGPKDDE